MNSLTLVYFLCCSVLFYYWATGDNEKDKIETDSSHCSHVWPDDYLASLAWLLLLLLMNDPNLCD